LSGMASIIPSVWNCEKCIFCYDYCETRMNPETEIDFSKLSLLRAVAECRSFTGAAEKSGISQSALSRQIRGLEEILGVKLLERTTRKVSITEAGAILLRETEAIPNILSGALRRIAEECRDVPREIAVGISTELALAHTPGLFRARKNGDDASKIVVSQENEDVLFERVKANALDLAILCETGKRLDQVETMHRMEDAFVIVAPEAEEVHCENFSKKEAIKWAKGRNWILPSMGSTTRELVDGWAKGLGWEVNPGMELASFDLMIQFVALGMGVAFVPRRALSGFPRKHLLVRVPTKLKMCRDLVAVTPRFSRTPDHVRSFLDGILFS